MKKFLLIIALVPALTFGQNRRERKAQEKNDKITLANLKAHISRKEPMVIYRNLK